MATKLVTDSTSYIPSQLQEELDITVMPLGVIFPDESFLETEVDYNYFYNRIESEGIIPTSSQPSWGDMEKRFREILENGHDILAIFISSLMSSTYETALSIRDDLLKEFTNARITVLDSKTNCMSLGYPVVEAARAAARGLSFDQICANAANMIERMHFYFTPATLEYLRIGGRIGGAAAMLGNVLKMRPVLFVDEGSTNKYRTTRNSRQAINEILGVMDKDYQQKGLEHIIVHHINFPEKARELAQLIKERYGIVAPILPIGPVIGLHVGPGTIGLVYCTEQ